MGFLYKLFKTCLSLMFLSWVIGFIWYGEAINTLPADLDTPTDAIVVLTGGSNRVEVGFDLLEKEMGKKLFITGVHKHVSMGDLRRRYNIKKEPECCVELGYQAKDTVGNAKETYQWMRRNNYTSLRLVTANYHMPRSLVEFKKYLPETTIIPHPIHSDRVHQDSWWYWPGTLSLMVREYTKFLYVYFKEALTPP